MYSDLLAKKEFNLSLSLANVRWKSVRERPGMLGATSHHVRSQYQSLAPTPVEVWLPAASYAHLIDVRWPASIGSGVWKLTAPHKKLHGFGFCMHGGKSLLTPLVSRAPGKSSIMSNELAAWPRALGECPSITGFFFAARRLPRDEGGMPDISDGWRRAQS